MLPKPFRLRARKDFDDLWKRGRSVHGQAMGIRFARAAGEQSRFGVVVGLKVHKRAVRRNLVRRRIREALRREFVSKIIKWDIVVITRPEVLDLSYQDIIKELESLFRRARII